jgi:hypothetical protein
MKNLGSLQKVYKVKMKFKMVALIFGILSLAVSALFPVMLFLDDPFVSKNGSPILFVALFSLVTLFMAFAGILLIYGFFRTRNDNLRLYENGIVLSHKGKVHAASWEEIEGLGESAVQYTVNGMPSAVNYSFNVTKFDGEKFTVHTMFKGIEEIGERLTNEVFKRRIPAIINDFSRGEIVKFGRFSINCDYLFSEKRGRLPLSDVEEISVFQGRIQIRKKGKTLAWDTAAYSSIPNARIFLSIWENIR